MTTKIQTVVATVIILTGGLFAADAKEANSILRKMDDVMYAPKDQTGMHTIILIDKPGKQETRVATI